MPLLFYVVVSCLVCVTDTGIVVCVPCVCAACVLNAALIFYNGNYYSQRVIANEARCRTLEDVKKEKTGRASKSKGE